MCHKLSHKGDTDLIPAKYLIAGTDSAFQRLRALLKSPGPYSRTVDSPVKSSLKNLDSSIFHFP